MMKSIPITEETIEHIFFLLYLMPTETSIMPKIKEKIMIQKPILSLL
jgi:hypothetical protein